MATLVNGLVSVTSHRITATSLCSQTVTPGTVPVVVRLASGDIDDMLGCLATDFQAAFHYGGSEWEVFAGGWRLAFPNAGQLVVQWPEIDGTTLVTFPESGDNKTGSRTVRVSLLDYPAWLFSDLLPQTQAAAIDSLTELLNLLASGCR